MEWSIHIEPGLPRCVRFKFGHFTGATIVELLNFALRCEIQRVGNSKLHGFLTLTVTMTLKQVVSSDSLGRPLNGP